MTFAAVFELAIQAERSAAEFFLMLAEGFSHVPGLPAFWEGMARDEVHHEKALEEIRESLPNDQLLLPADYELLKMAWGLQRVLAREPAIETLEDAYQTAHELENSEVNTLFQLLANRFISSEKRKQVYLSEIRDHVAKLLDFSATFGSSDRRRRVRFLDLVPARTK